MKKRLARKVLNNLKEYRPHQREAAVQRWGRDMLRRIRQRRAEGKSLGKSL